MKLYLSNWAKWYADTRRMIATRSYRTVGGGTFWGQVLLLQIWDRGTNTLAGGDPSMTLSGRLYRDRHDNFFARLFNTVANFLFHKDGPGDADPAKWPAGEGSANDRNLSNPAQGYAIAFAVTVYTALIAGVKYGGIPFVVWFGKILLAAFL